MNAIQVNYEYYDFSDDAGDGEYTSIDVDDHRDSPFATATATATTATTLCVDARQPHQSFCEHVPDYPVAHIERQLAADPERFAELFGSELAPVSPVVESRFGDGADGQPLCASRETIIYPKMGQTAKNTWMYIVNSKRYQQGIRVEMCDRVDGPCEWPSGGGGGGGGRAVYWPQGMRSVCRQKFTYRQLLAVDGYGRPVMDAFRMPCCCSCVLVQRMGY